MYRLRRSTAIVAAHLARACLAVVGSAGTNAPGILAERIYPDILADLIGQTGQAPVLVTGTNGKTTTACILAEIMGAASMQLIHNRSGANMASGILAETLRHSSWLGHVEPHLQPLLEVDEAYMRRLTAARQPRLVLVNNFFRDQLDRFGELRSTIDLVQQSLDNVQTTLVLNADDPNVCALHASDRSECVYYGFCGDSCGMDREVYASELAVCPRCNSDLVYTHQWLGQCGDYSCLLCPYTKPVPDIQVTALTMQLDGSTMSIRTQGGQQLEVNTSLPGLFNAYNVLAAVSAALVMGIDPEAICTGVRLFCPSFGRSQRVLYNSLPHNVFLIKNPIGASEVLRMIQRDTEAQILIIINDNYADGRDVSWLWDAYFEHLRGHSGHIYVSGTRCHEMSLRLEYINIQAQTYPDIQQALDAMAAANNGQNIYLLPTYTALLQLTKIIPAMTINT